MLSFSHGPNLTLQPDLPTSAGGIGVIPCKKGEFLVGTHSTQGKGENLHHSFNRKFLVKWCNKLCSKGLSLYLFPISKEKIMKEKMPKIGHSNSIIGIGRQSSRTYLKKGRKATESLQMNDSCSWQMASLPAAAAEGKRNRFYLLFRVNTFYMP